MKGALVNSSSWCSRRNTHVVLWSQSLKYHRSQIIGIKCIKKKGKVHMTTVKKNQFKPWHHISEGNHKIGINSFIHNFFLQLQRNGNPPSWYSKKQHSHSFVISTEPPCAWGQHSTYYVLSGHFISVVSPYSWDFLSWVHKERWKTNKHPARWRWWLINTLLMSEVSGERPPLQVDRKAQ